MLTCYNEATIELKCYNIYLTEVKLIVSFIFKDSDNIKYRFI